MQKNLNKTKSISDFRKILFLVVAASALTITDVLATNTNHKFETKRQVFTSPKKWQPAINFGGKYGNTNSRRLGKVALFAPLSQDDNSLLYVDFRFVASTHGTKEGNFGIGKRWLTADSQYILGVYGFYDRRYTEMDNIVNQVTLGAEAMSDTWDYRANIYYPQNTIKEVEKSEAIHNPDEFRYTGNNLYRIIRTTTQTHEIHEVPLKGFDLEIGRAVPCFKPLRLYGAYYHFMGKENAPAIKGFRVRADLKFNKYVSLQLEGSHDRFRQRVGFVGLRLTVPLGKESTKTRELSSLETRMTELPMRDIDIVTSNKNISRSVVQSSREELVSSDNFFVTDDIVQISAERDGTYEKPYQKNQDADLEKLREDINEKKVGNYIFLLKDGKVVEKINRDTFKNQPAPQMLAAPNLISNHYELEKIADLKEKLAENAQQLQQLDQEKTQLESHFTAKLKAKKKKINETRQSLTAKEKELAEQENLTKSKVSELEKELQQANESLNQAKKDTLKSTKEQSAQFKAKEEQLAKQIADLNAQLETQKNEFQKAEQSLANEREKLNHKQANLVVIKQQFEQRSTEFKSQLENKENELKETLEQKRLLDEEKEGLGKKIEFLQQQNEDLQEKLNTFKETELQKQLQQAQENSQLKQDDFDQEKANLEGKFKSQLETKEQELQQARQTLELREQELLKDKQEKSQEIHDLTQQLETTRQRLEQTRETLEVTQKIQEMAEQKAKDLEERMLEQKLIMEKDRDEFQKLQEKLNSQNQSSERQVIEELPRHSFSRARKQNEELRRQLKTNNKQGTEKNPTEMDSLPSNQCPTEVQAMINRRRGIDELRNQLG